MERLLIILLAVMPGVVSCATNDQGKAAKESSSRVFQPRPLGDEWSQWMVGRWDVLGQEDAGQAAGSLKIELALNGQFLIHTFEAGSTDVSAEYIIAEKYTLADGTAMEGGGRMTRKKTTEVDE